MDLDDITNKDAALVAAYQKFTTRTAMGESFSFWFDKGNNEAKYDKYIKPNAAKEINIGDELRQQFHELARAGQFREMDELFGDARAEVKGMLEPRMGEFEKSVEYRNYVTVKKAGNITKALKLLGLTGANATAMDKLLKEYAVGNPTQKKATLAKMEKIAKAEQIKAALKASGLI